MYFQRIKQPNKVSFQRSAFSHAYLVYTRKSTDDADNQRNSIGHQREMCLRFCERNQLHIAPFSEDRFCKNGIIEERHSGYSTRHDKLRVKKDGTFSGKIHRPQFAKLCSYLKEKAFKGVVFLNWDRASRNDLDSNLIASLIKQGADIRFVDTLYDTDTASGQLHMNIDAAFSAHYSRTISEKVTKSIQYQRGEKGKWLNRAPVGYLNLGNSDHKPFDPNRAPVVMEMFEKAAQGWGIYDIVAWAASVGFTMPPKRRNRTLEERLNGLESQDLDLVEVPISKTTVYNLLSNPFYLGLVQKERCSNEYIPSASHEALVSKQLFLKMQEALKSKRVSVEYTKKLNLPYRGLFTCTHCGRCYSLHLRRGNVYFWSQCPTTCPNTRYRRVGCKQQYIPQPRHGNINGGSAAKPNR